MTIITNSLWLISEKLLRLILGILVTSQVARHYGVNLFGEYSLILAFMSILTVINSLGFNRVYIREITNRSNNKKMLNSIIITSLILRLVCALSITLICLFISLCINNELSLFYITALLSLFFISFDVFDLLNQALQKISVISKLRSVSFIVGCLLKLSIVFYELDFLWLVCSVTFDYLLIALVLVYATRLNKIHYKFELKYFSFPIAKVFLKESWPEVLAGLCAILYMRLDQIMLRSMMDANSVGIYSAAVRISEAWYFVPAAFITATYPAVVKWAADEQDRYHEYMKHIYCFLTYLSISVAIFIMYFSDFIINFIYGENYSEASTILIIHIWAGVFMSFGICSGSVLAAEKKLKLNLYRNIAGLIVNLFLNYILIPKYGIKGAAWATLISMMISFYLFDFTNKSLRNMFWDKTSSINIISLFELLFFIKKNLKKRDM